MIALARARGSTAKTRDGARQFLLRQCQMEQILNRGQKIVRRGQKAAEYRTERLNDRLEAHKKAVDGKPTYLAQLRAFRKLAVQLQDLLTPMYGGNVEAALRARALNLPGALVPFSKLNVNANHAQIAGWSVVLRETTTPVYLYSKAYHRTYGPTILTSNRHIEFRRLSRGRLDVRRVDFKGWRGNYLEQALLEADIVQKQKGLRHIRLHPVYEVQERPPTATCRVFQRSLGGEFVDLCVVSAANETFHAPTLAQALAGLQHKQAAVIAQSATQVSLKLAQDLGFCAPGIRLFARTFGFDTRQRYTPDEIYQVVRQDPAAAPFLPELRRLATAVGFQALELR